MTGGSGYGYPARPDPSSRVIPAGQGESRVPVPGRVESRRVNQSAKDLLGTKPSGSWTDVLSFARPGLTTTFLGRAPGGNVQSPNFRATEWNDSYKRYGHFLYAESSFAASDTLIETGIEPRALVDPALPVVPLIYRVRDVVAIESPGGNEAGFYIGSSSNLSVSLNPSPRTTGFRNYTGSTWQTLYARNDATEPYPRVDTLASCTEPVELMFELDGVLKEIRWYVDTVLVHSLRPAADGTAYSGSGLAEPKLFWSCKAVSPMKYWHMLGAAPMVELEVVDA